MSFFHPLMLINGINESIILQIIQFISFGNKPPTGASTFHSTHFHLYRFTTPHSTFSSIVADEAFGVPLLQYMSVGRSVKFNSLSKVEYQIVDLLYVLPRKILSNREIYLLSFNWRVIHTTN